MKMRNLPLIFTLIIALVLVGYSISYVHSMSDTWEKEEQEAAAIRLVDLQNQVATKIQRRNAYTNMVVTVLPGLMMGGVLIGFIGLGLVLIIFAHKRIESSNRQQNGSFALKWTEIQGVKVLIDPNKMSQSFGAMTADNVLNSKQAFTDANAQLKLLEQVNRNRLVNSLPETGFKYAATGKFLAGSYDRQFKVVEEPPVIEDKTISVTSLSLSEAINQSTSENWLMGQSESGYCELNINDLVHVGLIGATKTGKTSSTALLAMIYALKNKFHVIALDGKGGIDWQPYASHIEVYATDYTTFPDQINQICDLHDKRMKELQRLGASNIDELTDFKIPHVLVILEEFGYISTALKAANKKAYSECISKLSNLMRVSRATGIHFLIIDQKPNDWDSSIVANVKGWICYRIKGKLANGIGEYYLGELKPVGQFSYENEAYDAWYTKGEIDKLLSVISKRKLTLLKPVIAKTDNESSMSFQAKTPHISVTDKISNTPIIDVVTSDKTAVTSDNEGLSLNRPAVTSQEKDMVYKIYLANGKKKNATCKAIWGKAGGYLKYLNAVISEKEDKNEVV